MLSRAEEINVTLPDGSKRTVESRRIYSSSNPTDSLIDAIAVKDLNTVKTLVGKGISVNSVGSSGEIPLMEDLDDDKAEILDFLLAQGANVNLTATLAGLEMTPAEVAVTTGHVSSLKKLLDHGVHIEKESLFGETVLFDAVRGGNPEIVKLLVEHGADIHHKNRMEETPLSLAEKPRKEKILEILKARERGAS